MRVLIYGAGRGGIIVAEILRMDSSVLLMGYVDDAPELLGQVRSELRVLGNRRDLLSLKVSLKYDGLVLSMATSEMMSIRKRLYEDLVAVGETFVNAIHRSCTISHTCSLGLGNVVSPLTCFDTGSVIGSNNRIGSHCSIGHHSSVGNHNLIGSGCLIGALVDIGDSCVLGQGVVVEPGTRIANGTCIPSRTVVSASMT